MDADAANAHEFEKVAGENENEKGEFMHNMIGRGQLSILGRCRAKMQFIQYQICQKSRRVGCVIPHCKLQCGMTKPIFRLFLT